MPMDFPDLESLKMAARCHKFRQPHEAENDDDYRVALADHVASIDLIESHEIRNKVGWDRWNGDQKLDLLSDSLNGVVPRHR